MKNLKIMLFTLILCSLMSVPAIAGTWQQDTIGWKYQNDAGSYLSDCWQWIDGNYDGIAEKYYFDSNGYMLINGLTPDGCMVDGSGAWVLNNVVQVQPVAAVLQPAQSEGAVVTDPQPPADKSASGKVLSGIQTTPYDGYTIVVNTNTKKYHVPSCHSVSDISQGNLGYCSDAAYLDAQGYAGCKRCH